MIQLKKKAGRMLLRGLLQSFFIVVILLGVGIASYRATMHFLKVPEAAVVAYKEQPVPEKITEASVDDISKNLIYCYDEETGEISSLVLEVFHCAKKQITYITIPLRTRFTMSDTLYKRLVLLHPAIPQIIMLSVMPKYFEEDILFDYGVLLVEDLLKIDISYYTVIPKDQYDAMFDQYRAMDGEGSEDGNTLPYEVFSEEYIEYLQTIKTEEELSTYIEELYPSLRSNLPLYDKMNYLESYRRTPLGNVSFELIKGYNRNSAYVIDSDMVREQLAALTQRE